jgi:hypothetical protein
MKDELSIAKDSIRLLLILCSWTDLPQEDGANISARLQSFRRNA